jgi:hypothetical protein
MLKLESTPINTKGYESLLDLVENTSGDSFDLYYGLFMYNRNVLEMLERLDLAFEDLRKQLFGRLHEVVRKQLFGNAESRKVVQENYSKGHLNGAAALSSSSKSVRSVFKQIFGFLVLVSDVGVLVHFPSCCFIMALICFLSADSHSSFPSQD